ncbi:MAG: ABC transporter ATP-binding protein, partial [Anaerolineales bacterium]|nr:ABC transporter ATP-binding protein [Anaerolineales bacterium]
MEDREVILDIQNLRTTFSTQEGLVHAVNGISYKLHTGETLGIVGESGCGKSVSMLSVLRLLEIPPAKILADAIYFKGDNLIDYPNNEMRKIRGSKIAMIFQDPMTSLNPVLTIGFQIKEPLKLHLGMDDKEAKARAAELLKLVGIPDSESRLDDYPHQFSGGMRQRAMIAIALACNPTLLIADEPTTALDVTIQAQILELLADIQRKEGLAILFITHDLGIVRHISDRTYVMKEGEVVEEGPTAEIFANPAHPYTRKLMDAVPDGIPAPISENATEVMRAEG